jgi:hypothetical protein
MAGGEIQDQADDQRDMSVFHGLSRGGLKTKFASAANPQVTVRLARDWKPAGHRVVGHGKP